MKFDETKTLLCLCPLTLQFADKRFAGDKGSGQANSKYSSAQQRTLHVLALHTLHSWVHLHILLRRAAQPAL